MRMMDWFKGKFGAKNSPEDAKTRKKDPKTRLSAPPDPPQPHAMRVYSEYFVPADPENGVFPWLARVYGPGGYVIEEKGVEPAREDACKAAINWAEGAKQKLRAKIH